MPGGSVATTGEASDGAKRSTTGAFPAGTAAAGAVSGAATTTDVFYVLAARSETNVSFFGHARAYS